MTVVTHPNPVLREPAVDVDPSTDAELRGLVRAMAEAMYEESGVGLAAPQVGVQKRVIVFDIDDGLAAICNPVIVDRSEETELAEEGCLSLPGVSVPVERNVAIICEGLTLDGKPVRLHAEDLLARVIQHETDHLDGILIIDRADPEARKAALRAYNEIAAL